VKHPIRNETSLILVVALIFSGVAIPVLSGFLGPSQPPGVAAVQIGDGSGRDAPAAEPTSSQPREDDPAGEAKGRRAASSSRERSAPPAEPAPSAPSDEAGEDDAD
jgi:hypothetical protein